MQEQGGAGVGVPWCTYLSQAAVLDFIFEDEAVGVWRLQPAQEDTAFAGCLPGHLPWDAVGFSCGRGHQAAPTEVFPVSFMFKPKGQLGGLRKLWDYGNWVGE